VRELLAQVLLLVKNSGVIINPTYGYVFYQMMVDKGLMFLDGEGLGWTQKFNELTST
jgi:hypothetical protein